MARGEANVGPKPGPGGDDSGDDDDDPDVFAET